MSIDIKISNQIAIGISDSTAIAISNSIWTSSRISIIINISAAISTSINITIIIGISVGNCLSICTGTYCLCIAIRISIVLVHAYNIYGLPPLPPSSNLVFMCYCVVCVGLWDCGIVGV